MLSKKQCYVIGGVLGVVGLVLLVVGLVIPAIVEKTIKSTVEEGLQSDSSYVTDSDYDKDFLHSTVDYTFHLFNVTNLLAAMTGAQKLKVQELPPLRFTKEKNKFDVNWDDPKSEVTYRTWNKYTSKDTATDALLEQSVVVPNIVYYAVRGSGAGLEHAGFSAMTTTTVKYVVGQFIPTLNGLIATAYFFGGMQACSQANPNPIDCVAYWLGDRTAPLVADLSVLASNDAFTAWHYSSFPEASYDAALKTFLTTSPYNLSDPIEGQASFQHIFSNCATQNATFFAEVGLAKAPLLCGRLMTWIWNLNDTTITPTQVAPDAHVNATFITTMQYCSAGHAIINNVKDLVYAHLGSNCLAPLAPSLPQGFHSFASMKSYWALDSGAFVEKSVRLYRNLLDPTAIGLLFMCPNPSAPVQALILSVWGQVFNDTATQCPYFQAYAGMVLGLYVYQGGVTPDTSGLFPSAYPTADKKGGGAFRTLKIRDLLFNKPTSPYIYGQCCGYDDMLISPGIPGLEGSNLNGEPPAPFKSIYGADTMHTGKSDINKVGTYVKWNGKSSISTLGDLSSTCMPDTVAPCNVPGALPYMKLPCCSSKVFENTEVITGKYDGTCIAPFQEDKDPAGDITFHFISQAFRSLPVSYKKDLTYEKIKLRRYHLKEEHTKKANQYNAGYGMPYDAVYSIQSAKGGPYLALTLPHLHYVDPAIKATVDIVANRAYNYDEDLETVIDIEPLTGKAMYARKRLQVNAIYQSHVNMMGNVAVADHPYDGITHGASAVIIPMLWIEEGGQIAPEDAKTFTDSIEGARSMAMGLEISMAVIGALMLIGALAIVFLQVKRPATDTTEAPTSVPLQTMS